VVAKLGDKELPPLFERHVRRPRLTGLLDATSAQAILIIAPAGYGKTTLAAEWLQGRDAGYWYRATKASADIAAFSAGIVEVIQPLLPGAGDRVLQRLRVPEVPERLARILGELLAEDIQQWPKDKWLVVDDYHLVAESAAVEEFVDWVLTLSPVRLLVTSRARPAWASARRTLYGEILEISQELLTLTDREAREALGATSVRRASSIVEQARGWPALVGLASHAGEARVPSGTVLDGLYRYFAEEILRKNSQEAQLVLLKLAALPTLADGYLTTLDVPLETVTSVLHGQPQASIDEGEDQRLHPLLQTFLLRRFAEDLPKDYANLHERLIAHARRNGAWSDAFDLAERVGDLELAARIACEAAPEFLAAGRHETLDKWLCACEQVIVDRPEALLLHGETLLRLGRLAQAYGIACEVSERDHRSTCASQAWRLRGKASYWLGENERALTEQAQAIAHASNTSEKQEALWGAFLACQQLNRGEADSFLDELEATETLDPQMHLRLAVGRSVTGARGGTFRGAHDLMEASSGFLARTSDPEAKSSFLAHWAYVEVNRSRYERAHGLACEAAEYARLLRLGLPLHSCLACKALAEIGLRRLRNASRTLAEMKTVEADLPDPTLRLQTLSVGLKLNVTKGSFPTTLMDEEPNGFDPSMGDVIGLKALIAAARGDQAKARALADQARSMSSTAESALYSSFAVLVCDLATDEEGLTTRELGRLVDEAFHRECHDAYVLAYRAKPQLLTLARSSDELRRKTSYLLGLARDQSLGFDAGISTQVKDPLHEVLTKREQEVFALLCQGMSNAEIAKRLVISVSTAKVHVHNIMRKLGARSRFELTNQFGSAET
jgi:LuxR family transcriptional regulator, maltose regulon positive regulatory protein